MCVYVSVCVCFFNKKLNALPPRPTQHLPLFSSFPSLFFNFHAPAELGVYFSVRVCVCVFRDYFLEDALTFSYFFFIFFYFSFVRTSRVNKSPLLRISPVLGRLERVAVYFCRLCK